MSIRLMAEVWTRQLENAEQQIALIMADHADDSGRRIFPSVALIAWKADCSERKVQRIIKALRLKRVLVLVAAARQHRPTEYRMDLAAVPAKPPFRPDDEDETRGVILAPLENAETGPGVPNQVARGAKSRARGDIALTPYPPVEPPGESPNTVAAAPPAGLDPKKVLLATFQESAGIDLPETTNERERKKVGATWWAAFAHMQKTAGATAPAELKATIDYMRGAGLTIKAPSSCVGIFTSRHGAAKTGANTNGRSDKAGAGSAGGIPEARRPATFTVSKEGGPKRPASD